jgi:hypothetical protein
MVYDGGRWQVFRSDSIEEWDDNQNGTVEGLAEHMNDFTTEELVSTTLCFIPPLPYVQDSMQNV